MTMVLPEDCHL